jgi:hypothetical protein
VESTHTEHGGHLVAAGYTFSMLEQARALIRIGRGDSFDDVQRLLDEVFTQAALAENAVELRRAYRRRTVMERVRLLGVLIALGGLLIVLAAAALLFLDVIDPGPAAVMGIVGISLMAAMSLVTVARRY